MDTSESLVSESLIVPHQRLSAHHLCAYVFIAPRGSRVWLRLQRVPAVVFEDTEGIQRLVGELSWRLQVSVVMGTTELPA